MAIGNVLKQFVSNSNQLRDLIYVLQRGHPDSNYKRMNAPRETEN